MLQVSPISFTMRNFDLGLIIEGGSHWMIESVSKKLQYYKIHRYSISL